MCLFDALITDDFLRSSFVGYRILAIVRMITALLLWGLLVFAAIMEFDGGQFFLYFTVWSLLIQAVYFTVSAVLGFRYTQTTSFREASGVTSSFLLAGLKHRLPLGYRCLWFLFELQFSFQLVTTVLFWALLYEPCSLTALEGIPDVLMHSVPGAAAVVELVLNQITFAPAHFLVVLSVLAVYLGIMFVWSLALHRFWLYHFLNIYSSGAAYMYPILFGAFVVAFFLGYAGAKLRDHFTLRHSPDTHGPYEAL